LFNYNSLLMTQHRCFLLAKRFLIITCFLLGLYLSFFFISSDYPSFLQAILQGTRRVDEYEKLIASEWLLWTYKISKFIVLILFLLLAAVLYDCWYGGQSRFARILNRWIRRVADVVCGNILYVRQLDSRTKNCLAIIFGLQLLFLIYFILAIPFHYDESWSYIYFSGRGFLDTATFYPLPNNHIFYNLVAGVFDKLPVDAAVTTRLPSLVISLITIYYLFKLANLAFSRGIALLVVVLFAGIFPVLMYSVEARGYSFVIGFTVFIFYAVVRLAQEPGRKRYRYLYVFSMAAGFYSLPSFFFTILPVNITLIIYYVVKRQWRSFGFFIIDNVKTIALTVLLYAPVVYFNSLAAITKPAGSGQKITDGVWALIKPHLSATWTFLVGYRAIPIYMVLILLAATLLLPVIKKQRISLLAGLISTMLISPPLILLLFQTIPFERTWVYLSVPLVLAAGYLVSLIIYCMHAIVGKMFFTRLAQYRSALQAGLFACLLLASYSNFSSQHRKHFQIDYNIRNTFSTLGHEIGHINSIGYTSQSLEYYVTDDLYFECFKRNRSRHIVVHHDEIDYTEDILILTPDKLDVTRLSSYEFVGSFENAYSLFKRKR
jgi:hypothetical protein